MQYNKTIHKLKKFGGRLIISKDEDTIGILLQHHHNTGMFGRVMITRKEGKWNLIDVKSTNHSCTQFALVRLMAYVGEIIHYDHMKYPYLKCLPNTHNAVIFAHDYHRKFTMADLDKPSYSNYRLSFKYRQKDLWMNRSMEKTYTK